MAGETSLAVLLNSLSPKLHDKEYVFLSFPNATYGDYAELSPIALFAESEGMTLVVPKSSADSHQLNYEGIYSCITITVHSSLEAVGLTAALANTLTENAISANVIAAFYHDHIFVPLKKTEQAMKALKKLSTQHRMD